MTNEPCRLNRAAKSYLARFHDILEEMIQGMTCAPLNNSISHNFIVQMIPHHRAAIQMSQNVLTYTTDRALQRIAAGIITEQTKSIENMLAIEQCCSCYTNTGQSLQSYRYRMNQIMQNMFSKMGHACADNRISCSFMREMIPHHEGAIKMSETTLREHICPDLVPILDAIISSQKRGVAEMQDLSRNLDC